MNESRIRDRVAHLAVLLSRDPELVRRKVRVFGPGGELPQPEEPGAYPTVVALSVGPAGLPDPEGRAGVLLDITIRAATKEAVAALMVVGDRPADPFGPVIGALRRALPDRDGVFIERYLQRRSYAQVYAIGKPKVPAYFEAREVAVAVVCPETNGESQ